MTEALLIAAIVAAGAFCPLMMWIQSRRGRRAACCIPPREQRPESLEDLRRRRDDLAALIAEHEEGTPRVADERRDPAV